MYYNRCKEQFTTRKENTMIYQTEMTKLAQALTINNIPFKERSLFDGVQIIGDGWDTICHSGSYGHEDGLIEVMGLDDGSDRDDDVIGYLTAEDVLKMVLAEN